MLQFCSKTVISSSFCLIHIWYVLCLWPDFSFPFNPFSLNQTVIHFQDVPYGDRKRSLSVWPVNSNTRSPLLFTVHCLIHLESYIITLQFIMKCWNFLCICEYSLMKLFFLTRSWQTVAFDPLPVTFIRIVGTHNTANEVWSLCDESTISLWLPLLLIFII